MGFLSKLFGTGKAAEAPAKAMDHKGFAITAKPFQAAGGWQLAGEISKDGRVHKFIRADQFSSAEEAAEFALRKGQLIVDQMGDAMFA
jgi:hypothetical protein